MASFGRRSWCSTAGTGRAHRTDSTQGHLKSPPAALGLPFTSRTVLVNSNALSGVFVAFLGLCGPWLCLFVVPLAACGALLLISSFLQGQAVFFDVNRGPQNGRFGPESRQNNIFFILPNSFSFCRTRFRFRKFQESQKKRSPPHFLSWGGLMVLPFCQDKPPRPLATRTTSGITQRGLPKKERPRSLDMAAQM